MEEVKAGDQTSTSEGEKGEKKKSSFGEKFINFLSYGGFLLIIFGIFAILVVFSILFKK